MTLQFGPQINQHLIYVSQSWQFCRSTNPITNKTFTNLSFTCALPAHTHKRAKTNHSCKIIVDITGGQAGGGGSSAGGVGQPRTIYNQRHLSPHRMMHFGKRPAELAPPTIMAPRVYDLVQPQQNFPYLFSIELERGQTLQSVPEGKFTHSSCRL